METETNNDEETKETTSDNSLSIVEEAKKIRDEILKAKESLRKENDRSEQIKSEQILGGTAVAGQEAEKPKEETAVEYKNRIMGGG